VFAQAQENSLFEGDFCSKMVAVPSLDGQGGSNDTGNSQMNFFIPLSSISETEDYCMFQADASPNFKKSFTMKLLPGIVLRSKVHNENSPTEWVKSREQRTLVTPNKASSKTLLLRKLGGHARVLR
jgi:hypothetical protein